MKTFVLTLDCDWAPDFILDYVREKLEQHKVHATLFVTHASEALNFWKKNSAFELGWHPNFHANSTQGNDPISVAKTMKTIFPGAISMRTHDLYQSTSILKSFLTFAPEIKLDTSIYLPNQKSICPFDLHFGRNQILRRFPFVWEDDLHLLNGGNGDYLFSTLKTEDLCILNFHPIHIYLNTIDLTVYQKVRALGPMHQLTREQLAPFKNQAKGIETLFLNAISSLSFQMNLAEFALENSASH